MEKGLHLEPGKIKVEARSAVIHDHKTVKVTTEIQKGKNVSLGIRSCPRKGPYWTQQ
jgi:hypothetical protein